MRQFKVGDRVRFRGKGISCHTLNPQFYPINGTIGNIISKVGKYDAAVQWPECSTSNDDSWYAPLECLELVADDPT